MHERERKMHWLTASVLVYSCCIVSAMAAVPAIDSPICVVGAGASGLGTVLALNKKGYKNIIVFEKDAGPGGKAKNWIDPVGIPLYLGPVLGSDHYRTVLQLAAQLDVPITNVSLIADVELFNYDTSTILPFQSLPLDVTALQTAVGTYVALWQQYSSYVVPGYSNGIPPELSVPFSTWVTSNGLEALLPVLYIGITLFGYGSLEKLPTILALAYIDPSALEGLLGFIPLFQINYNLLLTKLASSLDAKFIYNAKIGKTVRNSAGVTIFYTTATPTTAPSAKKSSGKKTNKKGGGSSSSLVSSRSTKCSRLVVAFPQRLDLLEKLLDLDQTEVAVFEPVKTDQYFMTAVRMPNIERFSRADILQLSGVANPPFVIAQPPGNGQPILYTVRSTFAFTSQYGAVYSWKDSNADGSNTPISLEEVKSLVISSLSPLNRNASQPVTEAVPLQASDITSANAYLDYFPHYNETSIGSGIFDKLAQLQGYRSTYYTSALRSFEIVEAVLESAADLVATYF